MSSNYDLSHLASVSQVNTKQHCDDMRKSQRNNLIRKSMSQTPGKNCRVHDIEHLMIL